MVGHIQSVQCVSQVEAMMAAHNQCWHEIMDCIVKHGSEKRDLKLITCGKEKTFQTLWREEGLEDIFPTEQVEMEKERRRKARNVPYQCFCTRKPLSISAPSRRSVKKRGKIGLDLLYIVT